MGKIDIENTSLAVIGYGELIIVKCPINRPAQTDMRKNCRRISACIADIKIRVNGPNFPVDVLRRRQRVIRLHFSSEKQRMILHRNL